MSHYPVMAKNIISFITKKSIKRPFYLADCNYGLGGHSAAILKQFPNANIKAWQLDPEMIKIYKQNSEVASLANLEVFNQNFTKMTQRNFAHKFDFVLADLGFNSMQLQTLDGLSWNKNSNLDMRYSPDFEKCEDLINRLTFIEIIDILINYGDLNREQAKLAAEKIKQNKPIKSTFQLRDAIVGCFQKSKTKKIAQVFQALRIATNHEIQSLRILVKNMHKNINKNGLVMIITFHSLERDIIYKQIRESKQYTKIQIEKPSSKQIKQNSRSHSAQMLTFIKTKI